MATESSFIRTTYFRPYQDLNPWPDERDANTQRLYYPAMLCVYPVSLDSLYILGNLSKNGVLLQYEYPLAYITLLALNINEGLLLSYVRLCLVLSNTRHIVCCVFDRYHISPADSSVRVSTTVNQSLAPQPWQDIRYRYTYSAPLSTQRTSPPLRVRGPFVLPEVGYAFHLRPFRGRLL